MGSSIYSKNTGSNRTGKNKKKTLYIKGLGFPVFSKKTGFNRTRPVRFESVSGPVQLIFTKNTKIRFGWFFKSKPNRTKPNREHSYFWCNRVARAPKAPWVWCRWQFLFYPFSFSTSNSMLAPLKIQTSPCNLFFLLNWSMSFWLLFFKKILNDLSIFFFNFTLMIF